MSDLKTFDTLVYSLMTAFYFDNYERRGPKDFKLVKANSALDFLKNNTSSATASKGLLSMKSKASCFKYYKQHWDGIQRFRAYTVSLYEIFEYIISSCIINPNNLMFWQNIKIWHNFSSS